MIGVIPTMWMDMATQEQGPITTGTSSIRKGIREEVRGSNVEGVTGVVQLKFVRLTGIPIQRATNWDIKGSG
jgi:hypothetical protein